MSNINAARQLFEAQNKPAPGSSAEQGEAPKKPGGSFVVKNERCDVCGKSVYFSDKLSADGKIFHKACFRCAECGSALKLGTYAALEGKFYCKPHFKQLFALKGNYAEGFGEKKPDQIWREGKGMGKPDEAPAQPAASVELFKRDGQSSETEKKWQERLEQQRIEREEQEKAEREERARAIEAMKRNREIQQPQPQQPQQPQQPMPQPQQVATAPSDSLVNKDLENKVKQLEGKLRELSERDRNEELLAKENSTLKLKVKQLQDELASSQIELKKKGEGMAAGAENERKERERLEKRMRELEKKEKEGEEKAKENEKMQAKVKLLEKSLSEEQAEKRRKVEEEARVRKELDQRVRKLEQELAEKENALRDAERKQSQKPTEASTTPSPVGSRVSEWEGRKASSGISSSEKKELENKLRAAEERLRKREAELHELRSQSKGSHTVTVAASPSSPVMLLAKVAVATFVAFVIGFYTGRIVTPF